jgi:hypothetical protein
MTRWEYKWVKPFELSPRLMNNLGAEGWEYVGDLGGDWSVFKRPAGPVKGYLVVYQGKPCDWLNAEDVRECVFVPEGEAVRFD